MNILVDGIAFEDRFHSGIARYCRELFGRLATEHHIEVWTARPPESELPAGCVHRLVPPWRPVRRAGMRRAVGERRVRRRALAAAPRFDLFHSSLYTASPVPGLPEVVTIHDMLPERFPDLCTDLAVADVRAKAQAIERAGAVLAVSQATADDIAAFYPQHAGKVHLAHHGSEHLAHEHEPVTHAPAPVDGPYVLYLGLRKVYKNFRVLLDATAADAWPADMKLVVSGLPWSEVERLYLQRFGLADRVVHVGRLDDEALRGAYRHATALVMPSLWEGFGFPIIEAQGMGVPVVCSDTAVFREVAGDGGARFFDPRLAEALAEAVASVADEAAAAPLREAGRANVERFRWSRCVARTIEVYERIARPTRQATTLQESV